MTDRPNVVSFADMMPDSMYAEGIGQAVVGRQVYWIKSLTSFDFPVKGGGTYTIPVVQLIIATKNGIIGAEGPDAYWFHYSNLAIPHGVDQVRLAGRRAMEYFAKQSTTGGSNGLYRGGT